MEQAENMNNGIYTTKKLHFAIYLVGTGLLKLDSIRKVGTSDCEFDFKDPDHQALQLDMDFDKGATVSARDLFAAQKFVRRKMSEALGINNTRRTGEYGHANRNDATRS